MVNNYYLYVLQCGDNSLYGGFTNHLKHRLRMHRSGKGAKYTRTHLPVRLIYHERFDTKSEALKAEYAFKHQGRPQKIKYLRKHGVLID